MSTSTIKKGFTLIELLVVIAIIGLLSSIILGSLNTARAKGNNAKRISDLDQIRTALELYYNDNSAYPVGGWYGACNAWGGLPANSVIPGLSPTYLPSMPADPQQSISTNQYCYLYYSADGQSYKVLDYNLTGVDVSTNPTFVDPSRNYGQTRPPGCSAPPYTEGTIAFAVWSSSASMCW